MADFDPTVALQSKGFQPADMVAPLQAYNLASEANSRDAQTGIATQNALATYGARQKYGQLVQSGVHPEDAIIQSGMSALDPAGANQQLQNVQSQRQIGTYRKYDPANPTGTLASLGPTAVKEGVGVLGDQATVASTQVKTEAERTNLRGQIANGYIQALQPQPGQPAPNPDVAWGTAIGHAKAAGLIGDLDAVSAMKMEPQDRLAVARSWAGSGAGSVAASGMAAGAQEAAKALYTIIKASPGETVMAGSGITGSLGAGQPGTFTPPAPSGRSVAVAPPGGAAAPSAGALGSPPSGSALSGASATAPPMMTSVANRYGLPHDYLPRTAEIESGGKANAQNPSGASGLFQFMPDTWKRYGSGSPMDPAASTEAAGRLAADNAATLTRTLGRPPTSAELYLAHQQGAAGAAGLLSNPNARAADIVGAKAVVANGGTPDMTAGQFASKWINTFNRSGGASNFGLSGLNPTGPGVGTMPSSPTGGAALSQFPAQGASGAMQPPAPPTVGSVGALSLPPSAPAAPAAAPASAPVTTPAPSEPTSGRSAAAPPPTQAPIAAVPRGGAGLTTLKSGLSLFQQHMQELDAGRASQQEGDASAQFRAANAAQTGLMQLQDDLGKITPGKGAGALDTFLAPGSGAESRLGLAKSVNTMLSTAGQAPLFDPNKIAAAESAQKVTGRLGFDLAGGLGKGEAGYIVNQAIGLNPSIMSTPQGAKLLIGSLMATQQRQKDMYLYQQQYKEAHGGNPLGYDIDFDQNMPPMTYVHDAKNLARVPPAAVKYLQENGNNQGVINQFNGMYGNGLARYYIGSRTQ